MSDPPSSCRGNRPFSAMQGRAAQVAPASVARRIVDFLERLESERLLLFRLHLQATIRRTSPLLLDLAEFEGISLIEASSIIYPPQDWPRQPFFDSWRLPIWKTLHRRNSRPACARREAMRFERMFANPGAIIRPYDDPRGRFAIRPWRSVLGFTAALGPCVLTAFGSTAVLKLADQLPETVLASLIGRKLGLIVDHPIFAGREYSIRRVLLDPIDGMPVIAFHAKMVAYRGYWA
jgi:hypothetical protein